jgi:hypothetical protein
MSKKLPHYVETVTMKREDYVLLAAALRNAGA